MRLPEGDALVEFEGEATVAQVGTECHSGRFCWWGGNGDSIDTTLEREFDLSGVESATLEFWMWYEIEEDWDYAFVSVSTDDGEMLDDAGRRAYDTGGSAGRELRCGDYRD